MKSLARQWSVTCFSLWLLNQWLGQGLQIFDPYYQNLATIAAAIVLLNLVVKPLINLILLPINLLSFGAVRWVAPVVVLWLAVTAIPGLDIQAFSFPQINFLGIGLPQMYVPRWSAFLVLAYLYSVIAYFIYWLFE